MSSFFYRDDGAPRPNQPRQVGVAALIEHEGRLLFERRADAPVWGLPAGRLDFDETLAEALRREVREETGLEIRHYSFFGTFSDPTRIARYPDGNTFQLVTLVYRAPVTDLVGLARSDESLELRFFPREELPMPELAAVHRPIVARYLSGGEPPFLD